MSKLAGILTAKWVWIAIIAFNWAACGEVQEKELNNSKTPPVTAPVKEDKEIKEEAPKEDEYTEAKVDLGFSKEDMNYLMLSETFPMGSNFTSIQEKMPAIKGIRPEGGSDALAAQGLTEAKTKVSFLGKTVDLEFNFKNDSLYSFYYTVTEPNFNKAEKLYKGIQQFYNKKIGQGVEQRAEEETRHLKVCTWKETFPYGVMNYNLNTGVISWGFQNSKP